VNIYKNINSVVDRLTGFALEGELEKVLLFDAYNHDEIKTYQLEAFRKLTEFASKSEFYKGYADKPLEAFPLMERESYIQNHSKLISHAAEAFHKVRSSGSTGTPVEHYITREMLLAKRVSHQKMLHWYGLNRESSELKMGGFQMDTKTHIYYYLRNKRYFHSHLFVNRNISSIAKRFNRFKPHVLYGYPSIIHEFIMQCAIRGIKLHVPEIIVLHAENLYDEVRARFAEVFKGAAIVNQYWSTEANIAVSCPHGNLHLDEDTIICEVLNQDSDGTGDLYITNLHSFSLPLIRYKLGDRIKLSNENCTCGRKTRVIDQIEGRETDYVKMPDGTNYPINGFHFMSKTKNILSYQLLYSRKQKHMVLRYVPLDKSQAIQEDEISSYLKKQFDLSTSFEPAEKLKLSVGGKTKKLIDLDREATL
jgi:phenylacetate-coenzyme A ligase PaaK-like adenylate-forming protein